MTASARPAGADIRKAALDFESMLLSEMLRSMRESGGRSGWLGTGDETSADSLVELAEQHLARVIAERGGLGLSGLIERGLEVRSGPESR